MACWEIRTVTVEFKARNKDLLLEAITKMKLQYTIEGNVIRILGEIDIDLDSQTVRYERREYLTKVVNNIKVAYSTIALAKAASLKKWALRKSKDAGKFQLVRS